MGFAGDERLEGVVAEFDEQVGLGVVVAAAAGAAGRGGKGEGEGAGGGGGGAGAGRYRFHCTQIADRSRTIPVGQRVSFVVLPGRGGVWEAGDLRPPNVLAAAAGDDG